MSSPENPNSVPDYTNQLGLDPGSLDIVRDCADLQGAFPPNVELKFVYWTHGSSTEKRASDDTEDARKLARHIKGADVVALELFTTNPELVDPQKQIDFINAFNRGDVDMDDHRSYLGGELSYVGLLPLLLSRALKANGATKMPEFSLVDIWEQMRPRLEDEADRKYKLPFRELAEEEVELNREREATTLRQLHGKATRLASDGKKHQIAVIYGASHTLLAVATRALGAPTKRVFEDRYRPNVLDIFERKLRFMTDSEKADFDETDYERAFNSGARLAMLGQRSRVISREGLFESAGDLELLCLRAITNSLTGSQRVTFEKQSKPLVPYLQANAKIGKFSGRDRDAKKAFRQLISLAAEARQR